jgi:preprotein translocase subunit YajC
MFSSAYAQTAAATGGSDMQAQLLQFAPFLLIFVVFYFLLIRPQQQRAKELKQQQTGLRRGDRVVTAGGVIGSIARVINDEEVEVQIAESVKVRVVRSTITTILAKPEPREPGAKDDKPAESDSDETVTDPAVKKRRGAAK